MIYFIQRLTDQYFVVKYYLYLRNFYGHHTDALHRSQHSEEKEKGQQIESENEKAVKSKIETFFQFIFLACYRPINLVY